MILTGSLGIMHQYFLNNYIIIDTITFPDTCNFQSGIITTKGSGIRSQPNANWAAATTVQFAQDNIMYNRGPHKLGVWDVINSDSTDFDPALKDILGTWNCSQFASRPTIQFNTSAFTDKLANDTLHDKSLGFFYEAAQGYSFPNREATGAFLWSGNETDASNNTWSLRASVMGNVGTSDNLYESTNIECNFHRTRADWTPPIMPIATSFYTEKWETKIYGALMEIDPEDYAFSLKLKLEAMTMVSGSLNSDMWNVSDVPRGQKTTYACAQPVIAIYPGIWVLVCALLLILIPIVLYDLSIVAYDFVGKGRAGLKTDAWLIKNAPTGVGSWQLTLIKYTMNTDTLKSTDLKDYFYGWNHNKEEYEVNRKEHLQTVTPVEQSAQTPSSSKIPGVSYSVVPVEVTDEKSNC